MQYSDIVLKAKQYVTELLKDMESKWYTFHNLDHTLVVFNRASYLAEKEGLNEELQEIVQLAALFHDTGFVKQYDKNEPIWAQIAEEWLRKEGYPEDKIDIVKQLILATDPSYTAPKNKLEQIIKDADLDNLWKKDFVWCWLKLKQELENIKWLNISSLDWFKNTFNFISNLKYYTPTQITERGKYFEENKKKLKQIIEDSDLIK